MRRALAPYAIGATLVFVLSTGALAAALAAGGLLEERATASSPSPSASRAPIELSRAGRIAYWRPDPGGDNQLWVSNLDGSGRRAVAKIDALSRISFTRWSPDGNAIAYSDRGQAIVVQRLDGAGARYDLVLPQVLIGANARIIDLGWSTDSASLAATVRGATNGNPNTDTDVYVAAAAAGSWRKATALGNAFLSQWISADELLIHTQTGLIATQRADGTRLRPLTGLVATSPFVGDDGRIYFLAGQVAPTVRDQTVPVMNAGQARVWSMTADGGDVRQETAQLYDDVRLVTRWPTGRFVAHQGASTALAFLSTNVSTIDTTLGVVDRVVFSPDRRTAVGLTSSRIYRYDVAQPTAPVVLLADVTQPDAWYPDSVNLARAAPTPSSQARPAARYAFALGGVLWATDASGEVHLVRQLQTDDRVLRRLSGVAVPQWSPKGDRILYFDVPGPGNLSSGAVFVTDTTGTGGRLSDRDAAGPFPTWIPDGNVALVRLVGAFDSATFAANGEVRIVSPMGSQLVTTYNAREIALGGGKTYLIDNGRPSATNQTGTSVDHAILEQTPSGPRTITNAAFVDAGLPFDPARGPVAQTALQLSMLGASADGAFLSVRISPAVGNSPFTFALLRAIDGTPTFRVPGQGVSDVRWSPVAPLVGMTIGNVPAVRDAGSGAIVASSGSGRFAGWSPDGKWFYVARDAGLYAVPLAAGGEPVRISALGVPVSAAPAQ